MLDNLGEVAKPIDSLINRIADATGVLYEPTRIRKKAKAEADALIIKTKSEIDAGEIQNRALTRLVTEEIQKQENIEDITEKSFKYINEDAKPEEVEKDWLVNFFDKCKLVSDEDIQEIWAKVLSGETNRVGRFPKRLINFISGLEKKDILKIEKILKYCWIINDELKYLIYYENSKNKEYEIDFKLRFLLLELGIIEVAPTLSNFSIKKDNILKFKYFSKEFIIEIKNEDMNTGIFTLTSLGSSIIDLLMNENHSEDNYSEKYMLDTLSEIEKSKNCKILQRN